MPQHPALARAAAFCEQFNLRVPILMAPMASACPPSLAIAIANAGGLGGCGALMMQPKAIRKWAADVRAGTNGGFQFNLWIPDPPPKRDAAAEAAVRDFLAKQQSLIPNQQTNRPRACNQPRKARFTKLLRMAFLMQIAQTANRRRVSLWRRSWYR